MGVHCSLRRAGCLSLGTLRKLRWDKYVIYYSKKSTDLFVIGHFCIPWKCTRVNSAETPHQACVTSHCILASAWTVYMLMNLHIGRVRVKSSQRWVRPGLKDSATSWLVDDPFHLLSHSCRPPGTLDFNRTAHATFGTPVYQQPSTWGKIVNISTTMRRCELFPHWGALWDSSETATYLREMSDSNWKKTGWKKSGPENQCTVGIFFSTGQR